MADIHILNSETIDKIAAGEVVERPGSVVKELVENAIDAGATAVTVEAKDGGIEFIRVTDNGCGMASSQLRTAFLRHATSKIEDADDLARVSSLGFRGEALSSIAAVSKVEVITKTSGSITGSRILLEGAREVGFGEIGAPEGTTFLMRSLFYNTPVRRKFLKQPATEGGYIADLMEHLALSRPDISFKLVLGGQMKFHTSGNGDLREVIYRIYGRDVANALVPISAKQEGIRLEGYLGKPVTVRSNRNFEIYFINGRFIRSNVIAKAVEEGYKEYLMQHKFPLCVLHIHMDPGSVDVNVHPTKMDVRFSDAIAFCRFLTEAVRQTLRTHEMIPEASLSSEKELREKRAAERKAREKQTAPEPFEQARSNACRVMEAAKYTSNRPKQQDFTNNPVWNRVKGNSSSISEIRTENTFETQEKSNGLTQPAEAQGALAKQVDEIEDDVFFEETSELLQEDMLPQNDKLPQDIDTSTPKSASQPELSQPALSGQPELTPSGQPEPVPSGQPEPALSGQPEPVLSGQPEPAPSGRPEPASLEQSEPAPSGRPEPASLGQPEPALSGRPEPASLGRPEPAPSGRPEPASLGQPELVPSGQPELVLPEQLQPMLTNQPESAVSGQSEPTISDQPQSEIPVTGVQMNLFEDKILTLDNRSRFRIIGQVFETYWLIEFEEKLLMIDQHAAHEKVNYERLIKQYHEKNVLSQGLLPPVIVSLSGQEEAVLKEHLDTFTALGFEIEAFGGSEYALRSVPVDLYGCNEREMFLEVLDSLSGGVGFGSLRVIEEKIASMSCKAAVKGNNKLSTAEAETLIDELLTLENPYNCPHGRPTIITMTKTEMERKFKRIVS